MAPVESPQKEFRQAHAPTATGEAAELAELVRRIADGDEQAMARLYDHASSWVLGLACRIVTDRHAAEEVTLDVFLQVWRKAANFSEARGNVRAWIANMARSRAIDRVRAFGSRGRKEVAIGAAQIESASTATGPEDVSTAREEKERITIALRALPDAQRRSVELAFLDGMTHREIATRFDQPLGTVKTQIRLGVEKLRRILDSSTLAS